MPRYSPGNFADGLGHGEGMKKRNAATRRTVRGAAKLPRSERETRRHPQTAWFEAYRNASQFSEREGHTLRCPAFDRLAEP